MKKGLFIIMMLMLSMFAMAETLTLKDSDFISGDVHYTEKIENLDLWSKIKMSFSGMTVINGATCSIRPDKYYAFTPTVGQSQVDYTNTDHNAVAFQLFEVRNGQQIYLGENQILKGQTKSFGVNYPNNYWIDIYYCDSTATRTCIDSDGGHNFETAGNVKFQLGTDTPKTEYDRCIVEGSSGLLLEIFCDVDKSMASITKQCDCKASACIQSTTPSAPGTTPAIQKNTCYQCVDGLQYTFTVTGDCPTGSFIQPQSCGIAGSNSGTVKIDGEGAVIVQPEKNWFMRFIDWIKSLFSTN